jgi:hypothetical protein
LSGVVMAVGMSVVIFIFGASSAVFVFIAERASTFQTLSGIRSQPNRSSGFGDIGSRGH